LCSGGAVLVKQFRFPQGKIIKTAVIFLGLFIILFAIISSTGFYQRIKLPDSKEVNVLYLSLVEKGEDKGKVEVNDTQDISNILKLLAGARKSMESSVHDAPLAQSYYKINLEMLSVNHIIYVYSYKNSYYLEEPYSAVYKISKAEYKKVVAAYISLKDTITKDVDAKYEINRMNYGKTKETKTNNNLIEEEIELVEAVIQNGLVKSAAWQGKDIADIAECYAIHKVFTVTDMKDSYYVYLLKDDVSVIQTGSNGYYSILDFKLYEKIAEAIEK
jgi:hypothetical protein